MTTFETAVLVALIGINVEMLLLISAIRSLAQSSTAPAVTGKIWRP